jgi:hypothetical protein
MAKDAKLATGLVLPKGKKIRQDRSCLTAEN